MARRKIAAALATGVLLALAACSNGSDSPQNGGDGNTADGDGGSAGGEFDPNVSAEISLTWWGSDERAEWFNEALSVFNEQYPNITVVRNFSAWDDYWTARSTEAAGNALPDVTMMEAGYIGQFAERGLFLDLAPYRETLLDLDGFSDTLLGSTTIGEELVGVPFGFNVWSMMYHKDLLDDLGVDYPTADMTWEDFHDWVRTVNEAGADRSPAVYGSPDFTSNIHSFMYHLVQFGNPVFDENGEPTFTAEDVAEYLDSAQELRDEGALFPIERTTALTPQDGLEAGEAAVRFNFSTTVAQVMANSGTENIGLVQPPMESGADARALAERPSVIFSVAANSEYPDAAVVLVNFLVNASEVAEIFGTSMGVPATEAGRAVVDPTAADIVSFEFLEAAADDLTASYPQVPSGFGAVETRWNELHENLQYGLITSEQFADSLFEEMARVWGS